MIIKGNILNIYTDEIYPGEINIEHGKIQRIKELDTTFEDIIVPGFIDAHTHVESSMLTPSRFSEMALKHGTTAVVTDPHEIANVLGVDGIEYMIEDSENTPMKFHFTVPSCVPASKHETNGATINSEIVSDLISRNEFVALSEVMNYTDVLNNNLETLSKIYAAHRNKKPIDGHAPLLTGFGLQKYVKMGISTDHESVSRKEVLEKKRLGMKIMIREGSESHTLEEFINMDGDFIVTDDLKAEDLMKGHLNLRLRKAVDLGMDPFEALKMVTINPAEHYNLNSGSISPGKDADLLIIDNLDEFNIKRVIVNGSTVVKHGKIVYNIKPLDASRFNANRSFNVMTKKAEDFDVKAENPDKTSANVNVINVINDQIITNKIKAKLTIDKGNIIPSVFEDVLKISVVERYGGNNISNAFIKGFGLKNGAIASSISHDSHNIITVGTSSEYMAKATNHIIENNGGLVAISNTDRMELNLPIAGLMSNEPAIKISKTSEKINNFVRNMGCELVNPFSTLSFMALLAVPSLKISDKGLFDVDHNKFINLINYES